MKFGIKLSMPYICMYIHTYMHACIYVCMSYVHSYMPAYRCIFLHMHVCIFKKYIFLLCQNSPLNGIWVLLYLYNIIIYRGLLSFEMYHQLCKQHQPLPQSFFGIRLSTTSMWVVMPFTQKSNSWYVRRTFGPLREYKHNYLL